jgi:hypothetical protein
MNKELSMEKVMILLDQLAKTSDHISNLSIFTVLTLEI